MHYRQRRVTKCVTNDRCLEAVRYYCKCFPFTQNYFKRGRWGMEIQVRDPVHNFILLDGKEKALLETRCLQRLRGIKQLAMASLVYPGALHTRFDHTLGVVHVAGKMAKSLHLGAHEENLVRKAAMLHDIGHGPFSHVSENALEKYANRDKLAPGQKKDKIHEVLTATIIRTNPDIVKILGQTDCDSIVELLTFGHGESVNRSIVSGPLDADKQDYLLRDSFFCGVEYGTFDMHQLHRSLVAYGHKHDRYLMLKVDGIHAAEQYFLAKYYLTSLVYRHRVRLITDQMIVRAIVSGIDIDEIEELQTLYSFDNSEDFVNNYMAWNDGRFVNRFGCDDIFRGTKCQSILQMLQYRTLLKLVFQARAKDFPAHIRENLKEIGKPEFSESRTSLEARVAECIAEQCGKSIDSNLTIIHSFSIKSVKEMSRNDEDSVLIAKPAGPITFEGESALFGSIQEGFDETFVEIYAPLKWRSASDQGKLLIYPQF